MVDYHNRYPWAATDLLKETSSFTITQSIIVLCQSHAFSKTNEHDVVIIPCSVDESVCNDNVTNAENPFFLHH